MLCLKTKTDPAAKADTSRVKIPHREHLDTYVGQWQVDKIHFLYFAVVLGKWSPCYAQAFLQLRKQNCLEHEKTCSFHAQLV